MPQTSRGKRQQRCRLQGNSDYISSAQTKISQARIETVTKSDKITTHLPSAVSATTTAGTKTVCIPYGKMDSNGNLVPVLPDENHPTVINCDSVSSTTDNDPRMTSEAQTEDGRREAGNNKDSTGLFVASESETSSCASAKVPINSTTVAKGIEVNIAAQNDRETESNARTSSQKSPEKRQISQRSVSAPAVEENENKDKQEQSGQRRRSVYRFRSSSQRSNTSNDSDFSRRNERKNRNYDGYDVACRSRGRFNEKRGYIPDPWNYNGHKPFSVHPQSSGGYRPGPPLGFGVHNEAMYRERERRQRCLEMAAFAGARQFRDPRNRFPLSGYFPSEVQMRSNRYETDHDGWSVETTDNSRSRNWRQENRDFRRQRSYGTSGLNNYEQLQSNEKVRLNNRSHSENVTKYNGRQSYQRPLSFPRQGSDNFVKHENYRFTDRKDKGNRISRFEHFYNNSCSTLPQESFKTDHNKLHSTPYISSHRSTMPVPLQNQASIQSNINQRSDAASAYDRRHASKFKDANIGPKGPEIGLRDQRNFLRRVSTPLPSADAERLRNLSLNERNSARYDETRENPTVNPVHLGVHGSKLSLNSKAAQSYARSSLAESHERAIHPVYTGRTEHATFSKSRKAFGLPSASVTSNLIYPVLTELSNHPLPISANGQAAERRNQEMPSETSSTLTNSDRWLMMPSTVRNDFTEEHVHSQSESNRAEAEKCCLNPSAASFQSMIFEEINEEMARAQTMSIPMSHKPRSNDSGADKKLDPNADDFVPILKDGYGNSYVMTVNSKGLCTFRPKDDQILSNPEYVISTSADEAMQTFSDERDMPNFNTGSVNHSQMEECLNFACASNQSTINQNITSSAETQAPSNHQTALIQFNPVIGSVASTYSASDPNQSHTTVMNPGLYNSPLPLTPSVLVPVSAPPQPSEAFGPTHHLTPAYTTIQNDYQTIPLNYATQPIPEYASNVAIQHQISSHPQTQFTNADYHFPHHLTPAIVYVTPPPLQTTPVTPLPGNSCYSNFFMHHDAVNSIPNPIAATNNTQLFQPLFKSAPELAPATHCLQMNRDTETVAPVFNLLQAVQGSPAVPSDIPVEQNLEHQTTNLEALANCHSQNIEPEQTESQEHESYVAPNGRMQNSSSLDQSHTTQLRERLQEASEEVRATLDTETGECWKMADNFMKMTDDEVENWRQSIHEIADEDRSPIEKIFQEFLSLKEKIGSKLTRKDVFFHFMPRRAKLHTTLLKSRMYNEGNGASSITSDVNETGWNRDVGQQPVSSYYTPSSTPGTIVATAAVSTPTAPIDESVQRQMSALSGRSDLSGDELVVRDSDNRSSREVESVSGVHQSVQMLQNNTNTNTENRRSSLGNVNINRRILYWETNANTARTSIGGLKTRKA